MTISIRDAIIKKNENNATALIPYIMVADPDFGTTRAVLHSFEEAGVAAIELGLPFTDPIADGPVIQKATERALQNPFSLKKIMDFIQSVRDEGLTVPIALYTYSNLVFNIGYDVFAQSFSKAGVQGALIVDVPPEEAEDFMGKEKSNPLETIFLCSPTTSVERLEMVNKASTAFTYYVAQKGVTGIRDELPAGLTEKLASLRDVIKTPLGVGFGISKPEHAKILAPHTDAVVIGSAYVNMFAEYKGTELVQKIRSFTDPVIDALGR